MSDRLEKINDMIEASRRNQRTLEGSINAPGTNDMARGFLMGALKDEIAYRLNLKSKRNAILKEREKEDQHELF